MFYTITIITMTMTKHIQFPTSSIQVWNRYGKLTITKIFTKPRNNSSSTRSYVEYKCDCWNVWVCQKDNISRWMVNCWCEKEHRVQHWFAQNKDHNNPQRRFYVIYSGLNQRCNDKNQTFYKNYWWRWIKNLWDNFEEFKNDMRESYQEFVTEHWLDDTTIDRIDVNWNYCKENCRWATREEQAMNKQWTRHIEIDWKTYTSKDISEIAWVSLMCAVWRMDWYLAWTVSKEEVFSHEHLHSTRNQASYVIIDWKKYSTIDIYTMCWIDRFEAYRRIRNFNKWKITKEQLFYKWKLNLRWK